MRTLLVLIVVALIAAACTRTTSADPGAEGSSPPPSAGDRTSASEDAVARNDIPEVGPSAEPIAVDDLSRAPQFAILTRTDAVLELEVVGGDHAVLWVGPALDPGEPAAEQLSVLGSAFAADGTMFVGQDAAGPSVQTWKRSSLDDAAELFTEGSRPRLSPDDERLYVLRGSEVVSLDAASGDARWSVDLGGPVESLAVSPNGELLAAHTVSDAADPTTWVISADGSTLTPVKVSGEPSWRSPAWRSDVELTVVPGLGGGAGLVSVDPRSFVVADTLRVDLDIRTIDWDLSGEWLLITDAEGVVHWWFDGSTGVLIDDEIVSARW